LKNIKHLEGENMKLTEYRKTLSPGQSLVCAQCLCEAKKVEGAKRGLIAIKKVFSEKVVSFWGESIPEYEIFACGGDINWGSVDLDWRATLDGIDGSVHGFSKITAWVLKKTGLDVAFLNLFLGLNIPKIKQKSDERSIMEAIVIASLLLPSK
jgi:hypothetical protein